jgi:DNA-binding transcriptional ArsR family regulator
MNQMTLNQTFAALSDPARRDLIIQLVAGPKTAGTLAKPFQISRPAISRHLRVLREAGVVRVEVNGREHWYHLNTSALQDAQTWLDDIQQMWGTALGSLRDFVENNV